eukprot:3853732-Rhodomonas_salina.6
MLTSSFELLRTMAPLCTRAALGGGIERLGALAAAVKAGDCATVRWYDCRGALECWRAAGSKSEGSAGRVELCSCAGAIGGGRGWLKFEMLISLFVFTLAAWSLQRTCRAPVLPDARRMTRAAEQDLRVRNAGLTLRSR